MAYGATTSTPPIPAIQNDSLQEIPAEPIPEDEQERLQKDDPACLHHNRSMKQKLKTFYDRNFGLVLVFLAQTCGSIMNTAAKLLATGYETKFHAMQVIFIRMSCTTVLGMAYMAYNRTPDFPLGQKGIRGLLILRGTCGFVGLFGLYCTLFPYCLYHVRSGERCILTSCRFVVLAQHLRRHSNHLHHSNIDGTSLLHLATRTVHHPRSTRCTHRVLWCPARCKAGVALPKSGRGSHHRRARAQRSFADA